MAKMSKKSRNQLLAVIAFMVALGFFMWPGFNGQTAWQRVRGKPASSSSTPRTATPRHKPSIADKFRYQQQPAGSGMPTRGSDPKALPVHDVTARDQAQLDALIRRKTRNR